MKLRRTMGSFGSDEYSIVKYLLVVYCVIIYEVIINIMVELAA